MQDRFKFRAGFTVSYIDDNENDRDIQLFIKGYFSVDCGGAGIVVHSNVIDEALNDTDLSLTEKKSVIKNLETNYCENDEYWFIDNLDFLEQSTSLKDKNGKLIYEGDIVEQEGNFYKVIFSYDNVASCGCCIDKFSGCGFVMEDKYGSRGDLDSYSELKIIGNIHKNPDLLENKDE